MADTTWDAHLYDQKHSFVSGYGQHLLSLLDPQPGEKILDLGSGTGHLAKAIADKGAQVVGIDSAQTMVEAARTAYPELEFHVSDARTFTFPYQFDAVFSNATLHWIQEAEAVIKAISHALKPGGRLVLEMGGKGNVATIVAATRQAIRELLHSEIDSGWYFPSIGEYTPLLERHNFEVRSAFLFDRPTRLEDGEQGLRAWLQMFGGHLLQTVPTDVRPQVLARVEALAQDRLFQDGAWVVDYRRLRVLAYKNE